MLPRACAWSSPARGPPRRSYPPAAAPRPALPPRPAAPAAPSLPRPRPLPTRRHPTVSAAAARAEAQTAAQWPPARPARPAECRARWTALCRCRKRGGGHGSRLRSQGCEDGTRAAGMGWRRRAQRTKECGGSMQACRKCSFF
eukprot:366412-Chlamydomonas_euryale.AAC.24